MNKKRAEKQLAIEKLKKHLHYGDKVYTIQRHRAASGMLRSISLVILREGEPWDITFWAANVLDYRIDAKHGGLKVRGCGMDMGFHVVYNLSCYLFPDGFGIEGYFPNGSKGRPISKDMANKARGIGAVFHGRNGEESGWDEDGGYALRQYWL